MPIFEQPALAMLAELAIKGTLILACAALLTLALRRASAAYRHIVWVCAFGAALALPLLLLLPTWRVTAPALAWMHPARGAQSSTLVLGSGDRGTATFPKSAPSEVVDPGNVALPAAPPASEPMPRALPWASLALALWALGALGVLLAFASGLLRLRRILHAAVPARDSEWNELATEAANRLGLAKRFTLFRSEDLAIPVAAGLLRPRVILPSGSDSWPRELRRAVLLHELAHIQRQDCLTQAMAQIACALFWFHPGFWWAASRMRVEREHACDDCVLRARTKATDYAEQLLGVVRSLRGRSPEALGTVAFARPSSLEGRLLSVLDPARDRRAAGRRVATLGALVAAVLAVPLAILEPVQAYTIRVESTRAAHHETANPLALRPSRLVAVPEPQRSIEDRMAWARAEASRAHDRVYWVGWRLDTSPNLKGNILSDNEGISLWLLEQHDLFTLGDVLNGGARGTWHRKGSSDEEEAPQPAALLARMNDGRIDRFRVQSLALPADFAAQPLYWMDGVSEEAAFAWLRGAASGARDQDMRRLYVESVGFMKRSDLAVPYLRGILEGNDTEQVRAGAAEGLGHHPSSEVVRLLTGRIRSDRSMEVRRASVEALGQMQTPEALEVLLSIARAGESDAVSRRAAYDALGEKVSERAVEEKKIPEVSPDEPEEARDAGPPDEASEALPQEQVDIQRQAIESLGKYPQEQSLPRLRAIAEKSPSGELRAQAVESIGRLGSATALKVIEEIAWRNRMEDARRAAVEAIGRQMRGDRAMEKLCAIARTHPSPETRRTAVEMIGRLDSPNVESLLLEIARSNGSVDVRRQAVESLGRVDGKQIRSELLDLARQDGPEDVQRQAVESLGRLDADVMPDLEEIARSHPSSTVRHEAVDSMMKRDPDRALRTIEGILRESKGKRGT